MRSRARREQAAQRNASAWRLTAAEIGTPARRGNADEIVRGLQELDAMQATGAALRAELGAAQAGLAAAGGSFLHVLDMMQEAARVQAAIRDSRQARGHKLSVPPRLQLHGGGAPATTRPEAVLPCWC